MGCTSSRALNDGFRNSRTPRQEDELVSKKSNPTINIQTKLVNVLPLPACPEQPIDYTPKRRMTTSTTSSEDSPSFLLPLVDKVPFSLSNKNNALRSNSEFCRNSPRSNQQPELATAQVTNVPVESRDDATETSNETVMIAPTTTIIDLQENLAICFVAAVELLRLRHLDHLTATDWQVLVQSGKMQCMPPTEDSSPFNAVAELTRMLKGCPFVVELLNKGFFVFDRDALIPCLQHAVHELQAHGRHKLAVFCICPSNHVHLALYHYGHWYACNNLVADNVWSLTLPQVVDPVEMVQHWTANIAVQDGLTIKAAMLLPPQFLHELGVPQAAVVDSEHYYDNDSPGLDAVGDTTHVTWTPPVSAHRIRPTTSSSMVEPLAVLCPISSEIMADPVTAADGYSYDRPSIEEHFTLRHWSPMTRQVIPTVLHENRSLRDIIDMYVEKQADAIDPDELQDFYRRRQARIDQDRARHAQEHAHDGLIQSTTTDSTEDSVQADSAHGRLESRGGSGCWRN